jgi:hypothetical protein
MELKSLKLVDEHMICHSEQVDSKTPSVEARCTVTFRGPDGEIWIGERVVSFRLRRQKEGGK